MCNALSEGGRKGGLEHKWTEMPLDRCSGWVGKDVSEQIKW